MCRPGTYICARVMHIVLFVLVGRPHFKKSILIYDFCLCNNIIFLTMLFVCLFVCLSVCLSVYLSVCLSLSLPAYLTAYYQTHFSPIRSHAILTLHVESRVPIGTEGLSLSSTTPLTEGSGSVWNSGTQINLMYVCYYSSEYFSSVAIS